MGNKILDRINNGNKGLERGTQIIFIDQVVVCCGQEQEEEENERQKGSLERQVGVKLYGILNSRFRIYVVRLEYFKLFYKENKIIYFIIKSKVYKLYLFQRGNIFSIIEEEFLFIKKFRDRREL